MKPEQPKLDVLKKEISFFSSNTESMGISLLCCGCYEISSNVPRQQRVLNSYALIYVYGGEGFFHSQLVDKADIFPGDIFLLFPGEWHHYGPKPGKEWKEIWIVFDGTTVRNLQEKGYLTPGRPFFRDPNQALKKTFTEIIQQAKAPQYPSGESPTIEIFNVLSKFNRSTNLLRSNQSQEIVRNISSLIQRHPEKDWDFRILAQQFNISYELLRKRFPEVIGLSPARFLNKERMILACRFLADGHNVKETAFKIGLKDPFHFSRLFKSYIGTTPKNYAQSITHWTMAGVNDPEP